MTAVERFKVPALYVPAPFAEVADKDGLTTTVLATDYDQLTAELQQSRDIREDMGLLLTMLSQRLGVSQEPHQTWNDRILEAASRVEQLEAALQAVAFRCGNPLLMTHAQLQDALYAVHELTTAALKGQG